MRNHATMRQVPPKPEDEDFFVRLATDALITVMTDLRCRVEHSGTPRSIAQVLLAEAHVAEAVGLLRTIQPMPTHGAACHRPSPAPPLDPRKRMLRAGRRHPPQRVAV
jgi:hypothetical protein